MGAEACAMLPGSAIDAYFRSCRYNDKESTGRSGSEGVRELGSQGFRSQVPMK